MSLKFEFDSFRGACEFGENLSRNLRVTSRHERDESKHIIVISEKNLNGVAATALAVSIATAGLISGQHYLDEDRFSMVLSAMQRANPELSNMTPTDIGDYFGKFVARTIARCGEQYKRCIPRNAVCGIIQWLRAGN